MDNSYKEKSIAEIMLDVCRFVIKESCGEETVDELEEMSKLRIEIGKRMNEPAMIPPTLVDRFNELCKKHFPPEAGEHSTKRKIQIKNIGEITLRDLEE